MMPCLRRLGRGGLPGHCRASVARRGVLGARSLPVSGLRVSEGPPSGPSGSCSCGYRAPQSLVEAESRQPHGHAHFY